MYIAANTAVVAIPDVRGATGAARKVCDGNDGARRCFFFVRHNNGPSL